LEKFSEDFCSYAPPSIREGSFGVIAENLSEVNYEIFSDVMVEIKARFPALFRKDLDSAGRKFSSVCSTVFEGLELGVGPRTCGYTHS